MIAGGSLRRLLAVITACLIVGAMVVHPASPAAAAGGMLTGRVLLNGVPLRDAAVNVSGRHSDYSSVGTVFTDSAGRFTVTDLPPGDVTVRAHYAGTSAPGWVPTYLGDSAFRSQAQYVAVGQSTLEVGDISMIRGARIMGTVLLPDGVSGLDLNVTGWAFDETTQHLTGVHTMGISVAGGYDFWPLPPGEVLLRIAPRTVNVPVGPVYLDGAESWWDTGLVEVSGGSTYSVDPLSLPGRSPGASERFGGAGRFETGVLLSEWAIPDAAIPVAGVETVYIANGLGFPDGLSAGPVAALDGSPLLFVAPDSIPPVVATEISRLRPRSIVIVGGEGVVSESVFAELEGLTSGDVTRVAGSDRYATSRELARSAFESADTAVLATGENFPDALAAGPVAAAYQGPVILIPPGSGVDPATRELLIELGVSTVMIAGGTGVVSPGIERALAAIPGIAHVSRHAGLDRYETAAMLAQAVHGRFPPDEVYLVSGSNFPDALAATWIAGASRASIFLSASECIPAWGQHVLATTPNVYLVGGEGVLSASVADLVFCPE